MKRSPSWRKCVSVTLSTCFVFSQIRQLPHEAWAQLESHPAENMASSLRLSPNLAAFQAWGHYFQSSKLFNTDPYVTGALSQVMIHAQGLLIPTLEGKTKSEQKTAVINAIQTLIETTKSLDAVKDWSDDRSSTLAQQNQYLKYLLTVSNSIPELRDEIRPLEERRKYIEAALYHRSAVERGRIDPHIKNPNFDGDARNSATTPSPATPVTPDATSPAATAGQPASGLLRPSPKVSAAGAPSNDDSRIWTTDDLPIFQIIQKLGQVGFGSKQYDRVLFTTTHNIPQILQELVDQAEETWGNYYNFNLPELTTAIGNAIQQMRKQIWIGDYSNTFPGQALGPAPTGITEAAWQEEAIKRRQRNGEIQQLIGFFGKYFSLKILRGLGSYGIDHNKFMLMRDKSGKWILVVGSFNFTTSAQKNQYNSIAIIDDPDVINLFKTYFQWMHGLARDFVENMPPAEPRIDPSAVPKDPSRKISLYGAAFPQAAFSPQGDALDWEIKATRLLKKTLHIAMFSYFPPPALRALIKTFLQQTDTPDKMLIVADSGQAHNEEALLEAKSLGARVLLSAGPDEAPFNPKNTHSIQSMMHIKAMIWDLLLLKGHDSSNVSDNAMKNNFENTHFWTGIYVDMFAEFILHVLAPMSYEPSEDELKKIIQINHAREQQTGLVIPWSGEPQIVPPPSIQQ